MAGGLIVQRCEGVSVVASLTPGEGRGAKPSRVMTLMTNLL